MAEQKTRNYCLDMFKGIASILVILIHFELPGIAGPVIANIGKFAVPLFFMTSGFYVNKDNVQRKIRNIAKLTAFSIGFYVIWRRIELSFGGVTCNHVEECYKVAFGQ